MSFLIINEKYDIEITAEGMTLPAVISLFNRDKTVNKDKFKKALKYIYFVYNPKSPFWKRLLMKRRELVCNTYLDGIDPNLLEGDHTISQIIAIYKELIITPTQELYDQLRRDMEDLQRHVASIPFTKKGKIRINQDVQIDVSGPDGEIHTITIPVQTDAEILIDNSIEKSNAIKLADQLYNKEEQLRARMEKEEIEQKVRSRRLFDGKNEVR